MKIGLYQMNIAWEDKLKNYSQLENILKEQGDKTIDLLLLPEMSFTGFSMNTARTKESNIVFCKNISDGDRVWLGKRLWRKIRKSLYGY